MMRNLAYSLAGLACIISSPLGAVGLGPLNVEGYIDGPRKGFQLTLYNPYPQSIEYVAYAIAEEDDTPQERVAIIPRTINLGARQSRRLIIVASDIPPQELYRFRVCAERASPPAGVVINARVCSKLSVRRLR